MNALELTGRARTHLVAVAEPACLVHLHAVTALSAMRRAALAAGFDLKVASSFRDFDRQLSIWNSKYGGERPLYDAAGRVLDTLQLPPPRRVEAILRWSALPGASRHHWGTDLDVFDGNAVDADYQVQLTLEEFSPGGPFAAVADWLETHAGRFGFFRPFRGILSGVQAEPWHVSFAPIAVQAHRELTPVLLETVLRAAPLQGKEYVLARLDDLHARYVAAIDWP